MSKHNKVNKSNYDQAGRLTPDEMGRDRKKQDGGSSADVRGKAEAPAHETDRESEASSRRRTGREG